MTYEELIKKLQNKEMFSFSRWGDGEFNCLFQDTGKQANCDHHKYFPDLGKRLYDILASSPKYSLGLQNLAYKQRKEQIDQLAQTYNLKWCQADILHRASINGKIQELIDALKDREVLLVGASHLIDIAHKEKWHFHEIPKTDCWLSYEALKENISGLFRPGIVILYAASMMSEVLIDDFHGQATQIDIGSVLDPYVGVKSRTYHYKLNI